MGSLYLWSERNTPYTDSLLTGVESRAPLQRRLLWQAPNPQLLTRSAVTL